MGILTDSAPLGGTVNSAEIVEAMKGHHATLVQGLQQHVDVLADDVVAGRPHAASAAAVRSFVEAEIFPHAAAEEDAVYPLAARHERLAAVIESMIEEHHHLRAATLLIEAAPDGPRAVGAAQALATVFSLHAAKENDFVLPALAADPAVDLNDVLSRMHALLDSD